MSVHCKDGDTCGGGGGAAGRQRVVCTCVYLCVTPEARRRLVDGCGGWMTTVLSEGESKTYRDSRGQWSESERGGTSHQSACLEHVCVRDKAAERQCRCQSAVISGTADGYGITATEHVNLDSPPDLRGTWPPHSGEKGEEKEVFVFVEASRFS